MPLQLDSSISMCQHTNACNESAKRMNSRFVEGILSEDEGGVPNDHVTNFVEEDTLHSESSLKLLLIVKTVLTRKTMFHKLLVGTNKVSVNVWCLAFF